MIKIVCDRCGTEIKQGENIGKIQIRRRRLLDNVAGDSGQNELDGKDYCSSCLDAVKDFLSGYQEEPVQPQSSKIDQGGQNQRWKNAAASITARSWRCITPDGTMRRLRMR